MKPCADKAHSTRREKMGKITGSPSNFESEADKAGRLASGGTKDKYGSNMYAQEGEG